MEMCSIFRMGIGRPKVGRCVVSEALNPRPSPPPQERPYLHTLRNSQLLQDQAEAGPKVLWWAAPVAAGGGLVIGVGTMMAWRAVRRRQRGNLSTSF